MPVIPRRNTGIPPQLEKIHVVPTTSQDDALAREGVSREVPCSALKGETVPDSLPANRSLSTDPYLLSQPSEPLTLVVSGEAQSVPLTQELGPLPLEEEGALREGPRSPRPAPSSRTGVPEGQVGSARVSGSPQGRAWQRGLWWGPRVGPVNPFLGLFPGAHSPSYRPRPEPGESRGSMLRGGSPAQGGMGARRSNTLLGRQGLAGGGAEMLRGQRETQAAGL